MKNYLLPLMLLVASLCVAQNCTPPSGGFTQANQPPVGCVPYPSGIFTKQLPNAGAGGPLAHKAANSDAIAQATMQPGHTAGIASPGSADTQGNPLYYGREADPGYKLVTCDHPGSDSSHNPVGQIFHIPNNAGYTGGQSDQFFTVWDQVSHNMMSWYTFGKGYPLNLSSCGSGSCNISIPVGYCNYANRDTDKAYAAGNGAGDSLGEASGALIIRQNEWMGGLISHAVYLNGGCEDPKTVFPAVGHAQPCTVLTNAPPHGSLYFLDYTDAQIASMSLPFPAVQKPILTAMAHYGGYFGDTGGASSVTSDTHPSRYESGQAYVTAGLTPPLFNWLSSQGVPHHTDGSSTVYTLDYWGGIPNLTGPNCPTSTCGFSQHVHIADECVAKALAGQSGGCPSGTLPAIPANLRATVK